MRLQELEVLNAVIEIVLQSICKQIQEGKVRMEGTLDRDELFAKSLEYLKKGKK